MTVAIDLAIVNPMKSWLMDAFPSGLHDAKPPQRQPRNSKKMLPGAGRNVMEIQVTVLDKNISLAGEPTTTIWRQSVLFGAGTHRQCCTQHRDLIEPFPPGFLLNAQ